MIRLAIGFRCECAGTHSSFTFPPLKFRIGVNVAVALMLGVLYIGSGNEGSRVLANYNLLFAILLHCSMATMMLTVLTCMFAVAPTAISSANH